MHQGYLLYLEGKTEKIKSTNLKQWSNKMRKGPGAVNELGPLILSIGKTTLYVILLFKI